MIESPRALGLDGSLVAWAVWVVTVGAGTLVTLATLVLILLRIAIAIRELRK
jgi:hypothetical protein